MCVRQKVRGREARKRVLTFKRENESKDGSNKKGVKEGTEE